MQQTTTTAGQTAQEVNAATTTPIQMEDSKPIQTAQVAMDDTVTAENPISEETSEEKTQVYECLGMTAERNASLMGTIIAVIQDMDERNIHVNRVSVIQECAKALPAMNIEETLYMGFVAQMKAEQYVQHMRLKKMASKNPIQALLELLAD